MFLAKKALKLEIDRLKNQSTAVKGLKFSVGRIFEEAWEEPMGPTPFPYIADLRSWDQRVLESYKRY